VIREIGVALAIIGIILLVFMTAGSVLPLSIRSQSWYMSVERYLLSNKTGVIVASSELLKLTKIEGYSYYLGCIFYLEPSVINASASDIVNAELYVLKSADAALIDGFVNTLTPENMDEKLGELRSILGRKAISKDELETMTRPYGAVMLECEKMPLHYYDISAYAIIVIKRKAPSPATPPTAPHPLFLHGNLEVYAEIAPSVNQKVRATIIAILGVLIATSDTLLRPKARGRLEIVKRLTSIQRAEGSKAEDKEERLRGREPS